MEASGATQGQRRRKRPEVQRTEEEVEGEPRTPVRIKIKRLERGNRTPGGKEGGSKKKSIGGRGARKKESFSPSQRRIESYFCKLKGGPNGLSRRSDPTKTQGTLQSPLEGVLGASASADTSRQDTSPLPVVRGGGQNEDKKRTLKQAKVLERWPYKI